MGKKIIHTKFLRWNRQNRRLILAHSIQAVLIYSTNRRVRMSKNRKKPEDSQESRDKSKPLPEQTFRPDEVELDPQTGLMWLKGGCDQDTGRLSEPCLLTRTDI